MSPTGEIERAPFACRRDLPCPRRRTAIFAQLITIITLIVSTAVVATVVTIGIARAETPATLDRGGTRAAVATFLSVVSVGVGGLAACVAHERRGRHD